MKKLIMAVVAASLVGGPLAAQLPLDVNPGRSERTRADLEELVAFYEEVLESPAYSQSMKDAVRSDVAIVRRRLSEGDFRLGDRITIYVEGEPTLPDTVPVQAGPMVSLQLFGDVPLAGVLRSEITDHLTDHLGKFIRDPVVRAQALMRVSIQGAVAQPGFYVVPADMLVTEALMVAGGPGATARLEELRIERGSQLIVGGDDLQQAMREGWTLDQLNLRAGDQITMPDRGRGLLTNLGLVVGLVSTAAVLFIQLSR